jgi:hypothetical protein
MKLLVYCLLVVLGFGCKTADNASLEGARKKQSKAMGGISEERLKSLFSIMIPEVEHRDQIKVNNVGDSKYTATYGAFVTFEDDESNTMYGSASIGHEVEFTFKNGDMVEAVVIDKHDNGTRKKFLPTGIKLPGDQVPRPYTTECKFVSEKFFGYMDEIPAGNLDLGELNFENPKPLGKSGCVFDFFHNASKIGSVEIFATLHPRLHGNPDMKIWKMTFKRN